MGSFSGCFVQSIHDGRAHSQFGPRDAELLHVGGNANSDWSNSVQYGMSYANANNDLTNTNTNIGARLTLEYTLTVDSAPSLDGIRKTIPGSVPSGNIRNKTKAAEMKRIGDLFVKVIDMDNLEKAAARACSSRKDKLEVAAFQAHKAERLAELQRMLAEGTFRTSDYYFFTVHEHGKIREIADLPLYPDRIAHWAIALVIEGPLDRRLIHQTHASRQGHGVHSAVEDIRLHLVHDPRFRFALKMDVRHFFASMDKGIAKDNFRHYLKDRRLLELIDRIIDEYPRPGIAIGGRLSPIIANLYLNGLDHHLKEDMHVHAMDRYMDDILILGYSKPWLHRIRRDVAAYLGEIGLTMKGDYRVCPIDSTHGVDFLGYVIYSDHILIRKSTKVNFIRAMREMSRKLDSGIPLDHHDIAVIASYDGMLKWCDSYHLRQKHLAPVLEMMNRMDNAIIDEGKVII